ncbi:hypothetical protein GCM10023085_13190 [Actinomadura viridis]|uniref:Asp23/Gls24 family envelope stress response protein n=1 Tax=Actinomadura viridis TaxID=58110 RepID=A0A931GUZ2_9ACTN|nr:hypothetical protein [Actinomadura viridis]MBG6093694.1 hypothetical protein [Actinomadura viridis]
MTTGPPATGPPTTGPATTGPATTGRTAGGRGGTMSERVGLAERIAAAVTALPDVAGLTAGPHGRVVTYRVGDPYAGVAVREREIEVGVVARLGRALAETAEAVREAALPLAGGLPVNVLIADVTGAG